MRLYKALLHLYPSSFRKEYEEELVHIFRERRTPMHNPVSIAWLWLSGFVDVVLNAACAHWENSSSGSEVHHADFATCSSFYFDGDRRHWSGDRRKYCRFFDNGPRAAASASVPEFRSAGATVAAQS